MTDDDFEYVENYELWYTATYHKFLKIKGPDETIEHLLYFCPVVSQIRQELMTWEPYASLEPKNTPFEWLLWTPKAILAQQNVLNSLNWSLKYHWWTLCCLKKLPSVTSSKVHLKYQSRILSAATRDVYESVLYDKFAENEL